MNHSLAKIKFACQDLSVPAYMFDIKAIEVRMKQIAHLAYLHNIRILLAVKSFPHPEILSLAAEILGGFDVSNYNEYKLVRNVLKDDHIVSITGPNPRYDLFADEDIPCFLIVNSHNEQQVEACHPISKNGVLSIRLAHDGLITEKTEGSSPPSRFGFSLSVLELSLQKGLFDPEKLDALHIHCGWGKNSTELYLEMLDRVLCFAEQNGLHLKYINLGGGLLPLSFDQIEKLFASIDILVGNSIEVLFEPGQSLDDGCGYIATKVVSIGRKKILKNGLIHHDIVLDISNLCHLDWSSYRVNFFGKAMSDVELTLYGSTCYEGDKISCDILPLMCDGKLSIKEGDRVIISNVSGYSYAMQREFNGIDKLPCLFV